MIYVPEIDRNSCYSFIDNNTIIKYDNNIQVGQENKVLHIALDNHYNTYYKKILISDNYQCIDNNLLTNEYYYRNDIVSILLYFLFFMILIIYIPYRLSSRFWRWLK